MRQHAGWPIKPKTTPDKIDNVGHVMVRDDQSLARWSDIISGDEVANAGTVDLSKVQHLLITLLLLGTYAGMMFSAIAKRDNFDTLPPLSPDFVGLMAISHAGYLAYKAVPKPAPDGQQQAASPQTAALPSMIGPPGCSTAPTLRFRGRSDHRVTWPSNRGGRRRFLHRRRKGLGRAFQKRQTRAKRHRFGSAHYRYGGRRAFVGAINRARFASHYSAVSAP